MKEKIRLKRILYIFLAFTMFIGQPFSSMQSISMAEEIASEELLENTEDSESVDAINELEISEEADTSADINQVELEESDEEVILNNGSRLIYSKEGTSYQWQRTDDGGNYVDIEGATEEYYDLDVADSGKKIRVVVDEIAYQSTDVLGNVFIFDLAKGNVVIGTELAGFDPNGNQITGTHSAGNVYVVMQSDTENSTKNGITFTGNYPNDPFDVTLSGINIYNEKSHNQPGNGGIGDTATSNINIPAPTNEVKRVTLRLKGENSVRNIHYYTSTGVRQTDSSLTITDINGDGETDGGTLYIPKKVAAEDVDSFVASGTKAGEQTYNHWNAGIGGDDGNNDVVNLKIAGGTLQVLTNLGDNCTAIGAGGNGYCKMEISGGDITAHCNGTGAAIGGGIGWNSYGGQSDVTISGGKIYAKNHGNIANGNDFVGGVAIGSGSTFHSTGSEGKVTITGGTIEAYGTFGNGIGGGNSSTNYGGSANIIITGGKVTASSIGGGNSKKQAGGDAVVEIGGTAEVTLLGGIGGGDSDSGNGGNATIKVTNGTINCGGVIGAGAGGSANGVKGNGGIATIDVSGGTLTAKSIGGGTGSTHGDGGAAKITISGGTIETGSIGGGSTLNTTNGKLGFATADISGGDIQGQFLMAAGGTEPCYFKMEGGTLHGVDTADSSKYTYVQQDGAAVYMDDPAGEVTISGGTIENCSAVNGGAIYMTAGKFSISGDGAIKNCSATADGGAVYLGGGDVFVEGGSVTDNKASGNGGAIAVNNGNYKMTGGNVDNNQSLNGSGGAIYVSANGKDVNVEVLSGSVSNNQSQGNGGALAVVGKADGTETINVTIGVNETHPCDHNGDSTADNECPIMNNNMSHASGGAIYVTGNDKTFLNIYCLNETGSKAEADNDQSDFMKMEGGQVLISTTKELDEANQTADSGNVSIQNTIYVTGGKMNLWGEMTNPLIDAIITVDIKKETDEFVDHRVNDEYYKLLYFENFTDPITQITTGQYKEKAIKIGANELIEGSLYSHPGYTIKGWNTDKDGNHDYPQGFDEENSTQGWYEIGDSYLFNGNPIGNLTIYAIWERNGYTIKYDPNVPSGTEYTGKDLMEDQIFTYDVPIALKKNQFGYPGHEFIGWNKKADGSGDAYADEQVVTNLTTQKGDVVTLYAQWKECDHNEQTHVYTYTLIDEGEQRQTIKKECSCKGYSATVTLTAEDTTYDMLEHQATLESVPDKWKNNLIITYAKKNGDVYETIKNIPKNAGEYQASISEGGITATVNYVIHKADQPAPEKPIDYTANIDEQGGKSTLTITNVVDSPKLGEDPNGYTSKEEHQIVYYNNGEKVEVPWQESTVFELEVALTNYYVYARYGECENYNASPATLAEAVYFFVGNVEVHVIQGEGVDHTLTFADGVDQQQNGINLKIFNLEGYYFPDDYQITVEAVSTVEDLEIAIATEERVKLSEYDLSNIPDNCTITITLPDAKRIPAITAAVTEKQIFGTVADDEATISQDSAYTAHFEIQNYDSKNYPEIMLQFSKELPAGTTIIMLDKLNNDYYWQEVTSENEDDSKDISLKSFRRMGGSLLDKFAISDDQPRENLELQFVVDFSKVSAGFIEEKIETSLIMKKTGELISDEKAPADIRSVVTTNLKTSSTYCIGYEVISGLTQEVELVYTASEGIASKWDNRQTALILEAASGTDIPSDAYIEYSDGVHTRISYKNSEGQYMIPLSEPDSSNLNITLVSNLFPKEEMDYYMDAQWKIAYSKAEESPNNGEFGDKTTLKFHSFGANKPAIKISSSERLYAQGNTVNAEVKWNNLEKYELKIILMAKNEQGEFVNTGWSKDVDVGNNTTKTENIQVPLNVFGPGSYCLQSEVMNGVELVKEAVTYFYFIVQ